MLSLTRKADFASLGAQRGRASKLQSRPESGIRICVRQPAEVPTICKCEGGGGTRTPRNVPAASHRPSSAAAASPGQDRLEPDRPAAMAGKLRSDVRIVGSGASWRGRPSHIKRQQPTPLRRSMSDAHVDPPMPPRQLTPGGVVPPGHGHDAIAAFFDMEPVDEGSARYKEGIFRRHPGWRPVQKPRPVCVHAPPRFENRAPRVPRRNVRTRPKQARAPSSDEGSSADLEVIARPASSGPFGLGVRGLPREPAAASRLLAPAGEDSRPEQTTSEALRKRAQPLRSLVVAQGSGKPPESGKAVGRRRARRS